MSATEWMDSAIMALLPDTQKVAILATNMAILAEMAAETQQHVRACSTTHIQRWRPMAAWTHMSARNSSMTSLPQALQQHGQASCCCGRVHRHSACHSITHRPTPQYSGHSETLDWALMSHTGLCPGWYAADVLTNIDGVQLSLEGPALAL